MKIKKIVMDQINEPKIRTRIAVRLGIGEQAVAIQLRRNTDDGRMTKMDALQAISELSGFEIQDILEEPISESAAR